MATSHKWQQILIEAINKPGLISKAYTTFHEYSIGNQILAMVQCLVRGILPSPISTYRGWQSLGRQVRRGEKAIELCQPITVKDRRNNGESENEKEKTLTLFTFKAHWFALSQTDGAKMDFIGTSKWKAEAALENVRGEEERFD